MKAVTIVLALVFAGIAYYGLVLSNPNRPAPPQEDYADTPEGKARDNMVGLVMLVKA